MIREWWLFVPDAINLGDVLSQRGRSSRATTPGGATPLHNNRSQEMDVDLGRLVPEPHYAKRERSPLRSMQAVDEDLEPQPVETNGDTEMAEDGEVDGTVAAPADGLIAEDEKEEGEEDDDVAVAELKGKDHMDTT